MSIYSRQRLCVIVSYASILFLLISGFYGYLKYQKVLDGTKDIVESYQSIRAANQTIISLDEAAIKVGTFLYLKNPSTLDGLSEVIISAQINIESLYQLVRSDATENQIMEKLLPLFKEKIDFLTQVITDSKLGQIDQALALASDPNRLTRTLEINQLVTEVKKIEVGQLTEFMAYQQLYKNEANRFYILAGSLNIIFLLFSLMLIRRFLMHKPIEN